MGSVVVAAVLAGCGTVPVHASPRPATHIPAPPSSASSTARAPATPPAGPVHVVGLGDSVTSGEHCACDDYVTGFGRLLAKRQGVKVDVNDDGESGSTSDGLADELSGHGRDDRSLQADVARADVVVITIGANDLTPALAAWRSDSCRAACYDPEVARMQGDLDRTLDRVQALDGGRARVLVTNYWNVFTDGDVARQAERRGYLTWSDTVTRQANQVIATVAAQHRAALVDLYTPFEGADGNSDATDLLAPDGDHPDAAGTALISRTVLATYESGQ